MRFLKRGRVRGNVEGEDFKGACKVFEGCRGERNCLEAGEGMAEYYAGQVAQEGEKRGVEEEDCYK